MRRLPLLLLLLAACGDDDAMTTPDAPVTTPDAPDIDAAPIDPVENVDREIIATHLMLDITARTGTATITVGPSTANGMSFEVGDETIESVMAGASPVDFRVLNRRLTLALPAATEPIEIAITYGYKLHESFTGQSNRGYTLVWPYYCGNLFPCHSAPSDGTSFEVELTGVPAGKTAVYAPSFAEAPSYQVAWSVDEYTEVPVGTTTAGTQIVVWHRPGEAAAAATGTSKLVEAFDWMETNLGPYRFGPKAGAVSVNWGAGQFGGMEHHPYWHVGSVALGDLATNVHEAAHGWFGDGIRIQCWEDFVLSEGTVSYLEGRVLDVVSPAEGQAVWDGYAQELGSLSGALKVWPQSCGAIDVLTDNLFTRAPYVRGALFYRALALKLGATVVDEILHDFYLAHGGQPARMADMLALIQSKTGYDPAACAATWLTSTTRPTPGPCP